MRKLRLLASSFSQGPQLYAYGDLTGWRLDVKRTICRARRVEPTLDAELIIALSSRSARRNEMQTAQSLT